MNDQNTAVAENPSLADNDRFSYFEELKKVKRFAEILLHQQLWCFGQDIKAPEGNLLVSYGFEKLRPSKGISGSTNYIVKVDNEVNLALWGFGIYYGYGINDGIYVGRYDCFPKLIGKRSLNLPVWSPSDLPPFLPPANPEEWKYSFRLISELFEWIAFYEEWVAWTMGEPYR